MKKAIFFDVDGTLMHASQGITTIRPTVKAAIRNLQEQGHYVFVATGRPFAFLTEELLSMNFDGYVLANGSHVMFKGETIFHDHIDHEFVKGMVHAFEQHNIQYILEGTGKAFIRTEFKELQSIYDTFGVMSDMLEFEYDLDQIDVMKMEMLCTSPETEQICLKLVSNHTEYDHYHSVSDRWFELYLKRNTKATGIERVLRELNIPIERSYAFGDGKNDIEMLSTVGCGIAMGNATDEVKSHAKVVTDTVHEDGVVTGIQQFVL